MEYFHSDTGNRYNVSYIFCITFPTSMCTWGSIRCFVVQTPTASKFKSKIDCSKSQKIYYIWNFSYDFNFIAVFWTVVIATRPAVDYSKGKLIIAMQLFSGEIILLTIFLNLQAFNWCKDPYFIKPESTPVYSLVREMGLLFGLILCQPNVKR